MYRSCQVQTAPGSPAWGWGQTSGTIAGLIITLSICEVAISALGENCNSLLTSYILLHWSNGVGCWCQHASAQILTHFYVFVETISQRVDLPTALDGIRTIAVVANYSFLGPDYSLKNFVDLTSPSALVINTFWTLLIWKSLLAYQYQYWVIGILP